MRMLAITKNSFRKAVGACAALVLSATLAIAQEVVLTVNNAADGRAVTFTMDELLALPQTAFETTTIWTDGVDAYAGPSLADVLIAADMPASDLRVTAINDYSVVFPAEKIAPEAPVLAIMMNAEPFSVREKGPIWLLFPFDDDDSYKTEDNFAVSVWQLRQIDVLSE